MRTLLTLSALIATPAFAHADGASFHVSHGVYGVAAIAVVVALVGYKAYRASKNR